MTRINGWEANGNVNSAAFIAAVFQDGIPLRHFVTNVSNPSFSEALGFECLHKNVSHVLLCSSNIMGQYAQGLPPLIALSQQEQ